MARSFAFRSLTLKEACADASADKCGIAGPEHALFPIDPLFDLAFEEIDHLLLIGMLMEIMTARRTAAPASRTAGVF